MSTLLFVDDDLAFLESIQRVFKSWSAGTPLKIETAHSVGDAIMILQETPVTVVVIDIRMPVVDGLQFLRLLNRKHPNVQKAILTGYAEEDYRTACLAHGAALFLEKPRNSEEMRSVYAALVQLLEFPQTRGFSGIIQQASLADMLQMLCTGGNSLVLQVKSREGFADIFIREGSVIHATIGNAEGYDAFYQVMTLRGGEFQTRPFSEPPKCTITNSWEFLLMESARLLDESGVLDEEELLPADVSSIPIPKTPRIDIGSLPVVPSYAFPPREPELIDRPVSLPAAVSVAVLPAVRRSQGIALDVPMVRSTPQARPIESPKIRLDELVICSPQGGLIKQEGSENPSRRIDLLELFSIKMRQICGRPEWGAIEFLSVHGTDYSAVVEFPNGIGTFGLVRRRHIPVSRIREAVATVVDTVPKRNGALI